MVLKILIMSDTDREVDMMNMQVRWPKSRMYQNDHNDECGGAIFAQ